MKLKLQERDFVEAAFILECEVEAVKAVCEVEAPRGGFDSMDRPVILFEGHIFHKYTKGKYSETHPDLSYPKWTTQFYGRNNGAEWERLQRAMKLDYAAAHMAASWGKFQIMGFNFALCGYTDLTSFVIAMHKDEDAHLDAFVQYMLSSSLKDELQEHRWADFARCYNGPLYWKNQYDVKLKKAYDKFKGGTNV